MSVTTLKALNLSLAQEARILKRLEQQRQSQIAEARRFRERIAGDGSILVSQATVDTQIEHLDYEYRDLRLTRTHALRKDRRCYHLAYCFRRGTEYARIEQKCWGPPDWDEVMNIVEDSTPEDQAAEVMQRFAEWLDAAREGRYRISESKDRNKVGRPVWIPPEPKKPRVRRSNWIQRQVTLWLPAEPGEVYQDRNTLVRVS